MHRGPRAKWLRSHTMDAARAANFYLDHDTYLDHALSLRLRGSRSELPDFVLACRTTARWVPMTPTIETGCHATWPD